MRAINGLHCLPLLILAFTATSATASRPVDAPQPESRELTNLRAFARLYGVLRFFHPSDEAATLDPGDRTDGSDPRHRRGCDEAAGFNWRRAGRMAAPGAWIRWRPDGHLREQAHRARCRRERGRRPLDVGYAINRCRSVSRKAVPPARVRSSRGGRASRCVGAGRSRGRHERFLR